MSWSKIDDLLPHHQKIVGAGKDGDRVFGWYVAAICYAQRHYSDGIIRVADLPIILPGCGRPPAKILTWLEQLGLWDRIEGGGWYIHDYLDWNESAADRRAKLAKDAARKRGIPEAKSGRIPDGVRMEHPHGLRTDSTRTPEVAPLLSSPISSDKLLSAPKGGGVEGGQPPGQPTGTDTGSLSRLGRKGGRGGQPTTPAAHLSAVLPPDPCAVAEVTVGGDTAYRCAHTGKQWSQASAAHARCPVRDSHGVDAIGSSGVSETRVAKRADSGQETTVD
jgi:hypothetical protein